MIERVPVACPYCSSDAVTRMYIATVRLDSCECRACSARWDEDPTSGAFRGRATRASVVAPRMHG
ncbi:MAG: hypothetical protein JWM05_2 [Acidimicrobiales bacterium]|nr:hypothetical protein [Acidimicrobiales bacterium]